MATNARLDDTTTAAIREALAAASRGRIGEACATGERALAKGGDIGALSAMLGMLYAAQSDHEAALRHLRAAHAARPQDPVVLTNFLNGLVQVDRADEAFELLTDNLMASDKSGRLLMLRGFLAQTVGKYAIAVDAYEQFLAIEPENCEAWNNLGNARRARGDLRGSIDALRRAVELDSQAAPIRMNLGTALMSAGDWAEAETVLREMASDFPLDPKPLRELHTLFKDQGRDQEALEAIEQAVERAPDDAELLLGLASHLSYLLDNRAAEAAYRRVLDIDPGNLLAPLGLAVCLDLTNRTDELSVLAAQVDATGVNPIAMNFIRALDCRRTKQFAEGLAALGEVPSDVEPTRRAHLEGQLLEGVGRYDEAFDAFSRMNELMRDESNADQRGAAYRNMVRERCRLTTEQWASSWRDEEPRDARPSPAFLVGFPRSGTTLLDTMLMGHPRIEVLEEEHTLQRAFDELSNYNDLPTAAEDLICRSREGFFDVAGALTPLHQGNLLVDKNPLSMNAIPLIKRLFPDAKIILALRHPCDVVLSCYLTNFRLNEGMASFSRLETAAELYDLSFGYLERCQQLMPMATHRVLYERVVEDRSSELRALFDFLELDWHEAVLDHQSTAMKRGRIKTASYAQVAEPIYKRSAGRWQNYRKHLDPILPVLRPWAEKFGYEL